MNIDALILHSLDFEPLNARVGFESDHWLDPLAKSSHVSCRSDSTTFSPVQEVIMR